ncbi:MULTISPECIES: carboxymethylenebutenolidase [unclassified Legionella]|uniref:carboxymethylenebutenolidase n=1 Tax=unclassified Legionella TaxID=2622702 RepID=UPI00105487CD|nr:MULTISPECIES: carboxymethylenebutenolidase [unclassified Legionella]MDI9818867.1 carboxymethylenebutenolidase [Legionella sp. PL877]
MTTLSKEKQALLDAFQAHVDAELRKDLETTLATMTSDPHINNIPTVIGGAGIEGVQHFYRSLILTGKFFPPDTEMVPVSRTIDKHQLVDEIIFKFTHTTEIGWMLPNIAPTGKRVEIPLVVIVGFSNGKVTHEHIYWDQASVLVQIGLLSSEGLPIKGVETAEKMAELRNRLQS